MDASELEKIVSAADVIQVGARNSKIFAAQKSERNKTILTKRGMSATIEWLMAAEYIMAESECDSVRTGIRTFDRQYARNTLDLSVVPVLRSLTHLPI